MRSRPLRPHRRRASRLLPLCAITVIGWLAPAADLAGAAGQPTADVAALEWMAGCWSGTDAEGVTSTEMWTTPEGGGMVGLHKDVGGGKMRGFEFLRIVPVEGSGVCYLASPGGAEPTSFCLIEHRNRRAVFENAAHDFPQRVIYWRDGERLHARIEGTIEGKPQSADWSWSRCP